MKLVLFDIDGTLLNSSGAGRRAMEAALTAVFGSVGSAAYHYDGKTDRQIVRELMRSEGHEDAQIDERMDALFDAYLQGLARELEAPGHGARVFPGVPELLDALDRRADRVVGLLTGNLERGAAAKLRAAGLDPTRFRVCAYGSDHEVRGELPAVAQHRARVVLGRDVAGEAVVVIGDTPADIACGRGIGARAIAVATGRYSARELAAHAPAAVFETLADTGAVMRAIDEA